MSESEILPESDLERLIVAHPEWLEGVDQGDPRPGHPEGKALYHVHEVLANIEKYYRESPLRPQLRVIALLHDTFKHRVDRKKSLSGENHHAMLARRFAERLSVRDAAVLDLLEHHDEAWNCWQKGNRDGKWEKGLTRLQALIARLGPNLPLYVAFYRCDNETGDKTQDCYAWFLKQLPPDLPR